MTIRSDVNFDTHLCQEVTKGPTNKGSESLSGQRVLVKSVVVSSPSRDSTSADLGGVTEKGALDNRILAESRLEGIALLDRVGVNTEGVCHKAGGGNKET